MAQWFEIDDPCTQGSFSIEYGMANEDLIALQQNQKPVENEPVETEFEANEYMCQEQKPNDAIMPSKKEVMVNCGYNNIRFFDNNSLKRTGYSICHEVLRSLIEQFFYLKEVYICKESVNEIIQFIKDESIVYSDTSFSIFLGLRRDILESPDYQALKAIEETISTIRDNNIAYHICCGINMPKYYFEVIDVIRVLLTDDEKEKICEENRIADNKYLFDDGVYGKKGALEYVSNNYRNDKVRIAVSHNFDHIKAYRIEFKRKKSIIK